MKKYKLIKASFLSCIVLFIFSCTNADYYAETSESSLNRIQFTEANLDTTKFEIESWVYANTLNGYNYNYDPANGVDTGDRVDQCLYWIDDPDCTSYPGVLLLKNDEYVRSGPFQITYGRHHINLAILIDEGRGYGFNKCKIYVASQCTGLGTVFFNETVNRNEPGGSHTNADFYAEFDVDYPYVLDHDYALDIDLYFEE